MPKEKSFISEQVVRLPKQLKGQMEYCFNADFSQVKIYLCNLPEKFNAHAFTDGQDIYILPHLYRPATFKGKWLIAHELTHIVQQRLGRLKSSLHVVNREPILEYEAELYGFLAALGWRIPLAYIPSDRKPDDYPLTNLVIQCHPKRKREEEKEKKKEKKKENDKGKEKVKTNPSTQREKGSSAESRYFSSEDDEQFEDKKEFKRVVAISWALANGFKYLIEKPNDQEEKVKFIDLDNKEIAEVLLKGIRENDLNKIKLKKFIQSQRVGHQFTVKNYRDWMALANHLSVNRKVQLYPCDIAIDFGDQTPVTVYYRQGNNKGDNKNGKKYTHRVEKEGYSSSFDCYFIGPDCQTGRTWEGMVRLCDTTAYHLGEAIFPGDRLSDSARMDLGHRLLAKMILYVYAGKGGEIFNVELPIKEDVKNTIAEFIGLTFGLETSRLPFMQFISLALLFRIANGDNFGRDENNHKQPYNFLNAFGAFRRLDNEWQHYYSQQNNYNGYSGFKKSGRIPNSIIGKHPQTGSSLFTNLKIFLGLKTPSSNAWVWIPSAIIEAVWNNMRPVRKGENRRTLHKDRLKYIGMIRVCNLVRSLLKSGNGTDYIAGIADGMICQVYDKLDYLTPFDWKEPLRGNMSLENSEHSISEVWEPEEQNEEREKVKEREEETSTSQHNNHASWLEVIHVELLKSMEESVKKFLESIGDFGNEKERIEMIRRRISGNLNSELYDLIIILIKKEEEEEEEEEEEINSVRKYEEGKVEVKINSVKEYFEKVVSNSIEKIGVSYLESCCNAVILAFINGKINLERSQEELVNIYENLYAYIKETDEEEAQFVTTILTARLCLELIASMRENGALGNNENLSSEWHEEEEN